MAFRPAAQATESAPKRELAMNNAEEMQKRFPELPPILRKTGMKRCY
jgi:hypothetical protein